MTDSFIVIASALLLDVVLGEPRRYHPLAGFGRLAAWCERQLYRDSVPRGLLALALVLLPVTGCFMLLDWLISSHWLDALVVYMALGRRSLAEHADRVKDALQQHDLPRARRQVGMIVSRDTSTLDQSGIASATVESVLENGNDAIFGAIFWYALAGVPGVVLFRLSNTLDAMWGYRNDRYQHFGRAAARLDDLLNFLPARLTALGYALCGHRSSAFACWRQQAGRWKSPNAGPVMAAGAGSLRICLGGSARYHGKNVQRPALGCGHAASTEDIARSLRLVNRTVVLWLMAIFLLPLCPCLHAA